MDDDFVEAATAVSPGRSDSEGAGKFANPKCARWIDFFDMESQNLYWGERMAHLFNSGPRHQPR